MGFIKKYFVHSDRPKRKYDNITARDVKRVIRESIITNDNSWGNYETNQQREVKRYSFKKVVELGSEAVPRLYKLLKDSDPRVRYNAIEALQKIDANEDINDPEFYNPIIKLKYDPDDRIRASAELAEVYRDNLILFKQDDEDNTGDNIFSSDDDTIYPTNETYNKESRKKRFTDELIDDNDEYMDDIIAGLPKQ